MAESATTSFQAYVRAQLDELSRRLLSEYEKQHGDTSSEEQEARSGRPGPAIDRRERVQVTFGDVDPPRSETPLTQYETLRPVSPGAESSNGILDELPEGLPSSVALRAMKLKMASMKIDESNCKPAQPKDTEQDAEELRTVTPKLLKGGKKTRTQGSVDPRVLREEQILQLQRAQTKMSLSQESRFTKNLYYGVREEASSNAKAQTMRDELSGTPPDSQKPGKLVRGRNREFGGRGSFDDIGKGSSVTTVEEKKAACSNNWVILPSSTLYKTWSHCSSFLVLVSCFFTPMRFGFRDALEPISALEMVLDVFFVLDIMITFNVALKTKDGLDTSRWNIFKHYCFSRNLWFDLVATLAWDDIWAAISGEKTDRDRKIGRALGLLRMLRLNRMLIMFREMQKNTKFNLLGVVVAKFVVFIMLCTHTAGCLFYALAAYADFGEETWIQKVDPELPTESLVTRYLNVLFWAVGTFKAGPTSGSLGPNSNAEKILACLTMMINICLQTYLVSNMAALLTTADVRIYAMRNQLRQVDEFAKRYSLPHELRHQLRTCVQFKFASDQELDTNVLGGLPDLYRQRISHVLFEGIISEVALFTQCAPLFKRQLHSHFKSTLYMPDTQLVNIDEPSAQLQIISEGEAEMRDRTGSIVGTCGVAESFSAVSFLCKVGAPFAVRTRVLCRILSLDHSAWENACSAFPENLHQVKMNLLNHCESKENEFVEGCPGNLIYKELGEVVKVHLVQARETSIALFCAAAARGDITELKRVMISQTPNCSNYDARTPLHLAASYGHTEAISLLLDSEAFVDPVDNFGRTPLLEACRCHQEKAAQLLYTSGALLTTRDEAGSEASDVRSKVSKDGVEKLTAAGELCQAASDVEQLWYLKMLLRYGANPNVGDYDARTALHVACACGNKPAVDFLASYRAINLNPQDNFGRTPLMEAVRHGHESVARILKERGAFHGFLVDLKETHNPNAIPAGQELCGAAFSNQITYMNNLLSFCDLNVDATDYDLRTALMVACAEGNMGIAVHLVQNGADINRKDRWGHTPITEAIAHGFPELADVLTKLVQHGVLADKLKEDAASVG